MNLLTLCLAAAHGPLVGLTRRNSRTFHAIPLAGIPIAEWPKARRAVAACGASVKILHPVEWWAPRICGTRFVRCEDCATAHGSRTRRPPRWAAPVGASS